MPRHINSSVLMLVNVCVCDGVHVPLLTPPLDPPTVSHSIHNTSCTALPVDTVQGMFCNKRGLFKQILSNFSDWLSVCAASS